jgi:hypothetical protein
MEPSPNLEKIRPTLMKYQLFPIVKIKGLLIRNREQLYILGTRKMILDIFTLIWRDFKQHKI